MSSHIPPSVQEFWLCATTFTLPNHPIMSTIRRLSDNDVRGIFESLHGNHPPPSQLQFRIVPVGTSGLKLSPPSHEFEGKYERSHTHTHTHTQCVWMYVFLQIMVLFSLFLFPYLSFNVQHYRWPVCVAQACKEESAQTPRSATSSRLYCERLTWWNVSLVLEWPSIPSTNCHSTTILLPKGQCRVF
jgi:hypothetical protein